MEVRTLPRASRSVAANLLQCVRRGRRDAFALIGVASIALAAVSVGAVSASAQPEEKVTICHRTNSATNPYVQITVDISAVDGDTGNDQGQGDHFAEHTGPLASSEAVAQALKDAKVEWGDIIPPVAGHNGLNWPAGQAILENGCNFVTPRTSPPETAPPTTSPPTGPPATAAPGPGAAPSVPSAPSGAGQAGAAVAVSGQPRTTG